MAASRRMSGIHGASGPSFETDLAVLLGMRFIVLQTHNQQAKPAQASFRPRTSVSVSQPSFSPRLSSTKPWQR